MTIQAAPGERYTIRRKFFKIFGAGFHIYDEAGNAIAYTHQKAFRLRENITLYADESRADPMLTIRTDSVLDFSGSYDVATPDGLVIGTLRRKGMKSSFMRDEWLIYTGEGREHAVISELGGFAPFARRYIDNAALFLPQKFDVTRIADGVKVAAFRQHFNPFIYKLGIAINADDEYLDDLVLLAAGSLIAAIEGRQA